MIDPLPVLDWSRRRFLAMWQARGGGFYALVALITFIGWQIEATLAFIAHPRLPDLGLDFLIGRFLAHIGLTIGWAAIWPLGWLGRFGPFKAFALFALALLAFKALRPIVLPLLESPLVATTGEPAPQQPLPASANAAAPATAPVADSVSSDPAVG